MKKIIISALSVTLLSTLILVSCKFKNNDNITPTYRNQSTGTGANPNIHVVTVTGTQTITNPATANTALYVGGTNPGWSFEGLASNLTKFVGHNGSTTIEIRFNGPVATGTFALVAGTPMGGQAQMIVYAAPGQPDDIVWYSKSGTVVVTASGPNFTATFSNVPCLQWSYLFPVVTVSGDMTC